MPSRRWNQLLNLARADLTGLMNAITAIDEKRGARCRLDTREFE
jgi:hypothetical protein